MNASRTFVTPMTMRQLLSQIAKTTPQRLQKGYSAPMQAPHSAAAACSDQALFTL
jgi:hypothetical protein